MRFVAGGEGRARAGPFGSGASSLHAKTFAADRERIFIGSFNFDPRSMRLNTELGFVIDSHALAGRLSRIFDDAVPPAAYEVRLSESGQAYWLERRGGEVVRHDRARHHRRAACARARSFVAADRVSAVRRGDHAVGPATVLPECCPRLIGDAERRDYPHSSRKERVRSSRVASSAGRRLTSSASPKITAETVPSTAGSSGSTR